MQGNLYVLVKHRCTNNGGTEYTTGIVVIGTPGEEGAATQFAISDETASSYISIAKQL